jgi:hypothetical protein
MHTINSTQYSTHKIKNLLQQKGNFVIRKKQITEELTYFKKRLLEAHTQNNSQHIKKYIEKILKLEAENIAIYFKSNPDFMSNEEKNAIIEEHIKSSIILIEKFV